MRRCILIPLLALVSAAHAGCGGTRPYAPDDPIWVDPDRHPFHKKPSESFAPLFWDGADRTFFYEVSRAFAVETREEAENVNAVDEVPDSSWFRNRIGRFAMTPEDVAAGPCTTPPIDASRTWTVVSGKIEGANPGFWIEANDRRRYLLKFDGGIQGPRASSAEAIVSRIYFAAGYSVPCNRVVFFDRGILRISPDAQLTTFAGDHVPFRSSHVDRILKTAIRLPDGRYRAVASLAIPGEPLGPWRYDGRRHDDPNDVVDHEDRREIRGSRLLAAWVDHIDARDQNTLETWIRVGAGDDQKGWVEHHIIDFADCLGSVWEPPEMSRRFGHAYWLDFGYVAHDFITLGLVERPWEDARFGPTGRVLGYYDVKRFDPERWVPHYPNPSFDRMTERDGAWMARIVARFTDADLQRLVRTARIDDPVVEAELLRVLMGRRDMILRRYLSRLSPLTEPRADGHWLCLHDRAVDGGVVRREERTYGALVYGEPEFRSISLPVRSWIDGRVCVDLQSLMPRYTDDGRARYLVADLVAGDADGGRSGPARVHLYAAPELLSVVGLERPKTTKAPKIVP